MRESIYALVSCCCGSICEFTVGFFPSKSGSVSVFEIVQGKSVDSGGLEGFLECDYSSAEKSNKFAETNG